jgi:type 1 glutamine amidotransferase
MSPLKMLLIGLLTLAILLLWASALGAAPPQSPVRVLIVTGVDHPAHDWRATAPVLRGLLESGDAISARIVEDPEILATDLIFQYDVLCLHFRNETPLAREAEARVHLARFLDQGKGLVLVHFASGAFPDWKEYVTIAGRVWDGKNTHDPRGPFAVRIVNPEHPITRGLSDFTTDDELYIGLAGDVPITPLAVARSRVTGRDHPMAFSLEVGPGRVFHATFGHDARALETPAVRTLLRQGTLWAAGRPAPAS